MPYHALTEPHIIACLGAASAIYTMVGHGGASAYIAIMALCGVSPDVIKPTALSLNIAVAGFAAYRYITAGQFRWRTLWPFLVGSVPFAYVGGTVVLPDRVFGLVVGAVLLVAAMRLLFPPSRLAADETAITDPPVLLGLVCGAALGLLSGLTGTGGGIFLSPLLLAAGWSAAKPASGVAALFILANSVAGLAGNIQTLHGLPPEMPIIIAAVMAGAVAGTTLGMRLSSPVIMRALGVVLAIAGLKLVGGFTWAI